MMQPKHPRDPAPTTPDPIEIAMAAEAGDTAPDSPARRLLIDQGRLVRWQIASERAGFALKMLTGLVGLLVLVSLGVMAWRASRDDSIVVHLFSVPPAFAAQGLNGEVLAGRFMGRLREVQRVNATTSLSMNRILRDDADAIRIEIPQTGVSLGELQRLLTDWLGRRTVVSGALTQSADGALGLDVRIGSGATVSVTGDAADLNRLIGEAAEGSFFAMDPGQKALYLDAAGRPDEALAAAKAFALGRLPEIGRNVGIYTIWAGREADPVVARRLLRKSLAILPGQQAGWRNLARLEFRQGREQAAFDSAAKLLSLKMMVDERRNFGPAGEARVRRETGYLVAVLQGDYAGAWSKTRLKDDGADALALSHDGAGLRQLLVAAQAETPLPAGAAERARTLYALTMADWPGMAKAVADYEAARADWFAAPERPGLPPRSASVVLTARYADERARQIAPLKAVALAHAGQIEAARAIAAATPLDCDACLRARAEVETAAANWAAADAWYARAAVQAPRLPHAETQWGASRLARGDAAGAVAKLSAAAAKGPRFADPLAYWGEALLAQGDAAGAAAKFAQAAKLAPRWGRLHLKWGEALAKLGKAEEARAKWRAAATMDLSPTDRAALKAHGV